MYWEITQRKYARIRPSEDEQLGIELNQPGFEDLDGKIAVRDISMGGLCLKVPLGNKTLTANMILQDFSLELPDGETCTLTGRVRYKWLGLCGVEFEGCGKEELKKVEAFVNERLNEDGGVKAQPPDH